MIKMILLVGSGGFVGSVTRFLISRYVEFKYLSSFPYGTLIVNIAGCFIIGMLYGLTIRSITSPEMRLFLATGFCGGLTTFSTFSYEILTLMQDQQFLFALLYVAASLFLGFAAAWLGMNLTNII